MVDVKKRLFTILILLVFLLVLIAVNSRGETQSVAILFIVLSLASYFVFDQATSKHLGAEYGKGTDWKRDILIASGCVFAFILADIFLPAIFPFTSIFFSLALIDVSGFSAFPGFLALFVFSPALEDIFRLAIRTFAVQNLNLSARQARFWSAAGFTALHAFVYTLGFYVAVTSPFVAAFVFALVADQICVWRKNILAGIFFHAGVNLYITYKIAVFAALGGAA